MTLLARIDASYKSMHNYFARLFEVLQKTHAEDDTAHAEALDYYAVEHLAKYHSFSHLVKPSMLMDIYSFVDFWMQQICEFHRRRKGLNLGYRDIRGDNDLHAYWKYLVFCADIDLAAVQGSYHRLDELRKVRNLFIHHGGHVPGGKGEVFSNIDGITLNGSVIVPDEAFIWDMLEHGKMYLSAAAGSKGRV